jgi:small conductance mechanosensitive channel
VGDFIEAQGYTGTVQSIQIFVTILTTADNRQVVIPNGGLSNGSLINYSAQANRRQEWIFGIDYGSNLEEAKTIIRELLAADERVLEDPVPLVELQALADSSVNILVRAWVGKDDFWPVYYDMNTKVYKIFTERGISIPFPQLNVHLQK